MGKKRTAGKREAERCQFVLVDRGWSNGSEYRPWVRWYSPGHITGLVRGPRPKHQRDKHKAGLKSNKFVRLYGLRLLPALYEAYNPMPYTGAQEMEVELAIALREEGYAVWQG